MESEEVEDWVCDQAAELYASAKGLKINWKRAWLVKSKKPLGSNSKRGNFSQFRWYGSEITILDIGCKHGCN